jgi:hypothetical protein
VSGRRTVFFISLPEFAHRFSLVAKFITHCRSVFTCYLPTAFSPLSVNTATISDKAGGTLAQGPNVLNNVGTFTTAGRQNEIRAPSRPWSRNCAAWRERFQHSVAVERS